MNAFWLVVALALVHPAVVLRRRHAPAGQRLVELLDLLDGRAVDDARPRQLLQQRDQRLHLLVLVAEDDHLVVEVRAIERRRDDRRALDAELEQDVVADVRRRGRGGREHRRAADDPRSPCAATGTRAGSRGPTATRSAPRRRRTATRRRRRTPRAGTRGTRDPPCAPAWSAAACRRARGSARRPRGAA